MCEIYHMYPDIGYFFIFLKNASDYVDNKVKPNTRPIVGKVINI